MISLKKSSLSSSLLFHRVLLVGPLGVPPKFGTTGDQRVHGGFAALIFIDQLDMER